MKLNTNFYLKIENGFTKIEIKSIDFEYKLVKYSLLGEDEVRETIIGKI